MKSSSRLPLQDLTVALPESRELDLLAGMLEEKGARTLRCPLVAILDAPDPAPIEAWLQKLIAGELDDLILMTGEGLRRLRGFAERAGIEPEFLTALGKLRTITRGPKPARALHEVDLSPDLPAEIPTTEGVIETLSSHELKGRRMGVQLYAREPNPKLIQFLTDAGASIHTVAPYVYAPASDEERVIELLDRMADGSVDAIAFTSAPQVDRLWEVVRNRDLEQQLIDALERTRVAAVGPVVAERLTKLGAKIDIRPERSFFMRPLVNEIVAAFRGEQ